MKFSLAVALLGCVATVSAAPILIRRQIVQEQRPINDVDILQFALTLEHLEASFYVEGLNKFSEADFRRENIPNPTQTFQNFHHILEHEIQHVKTLQTVITSLGGIPVPPCEYQFPFQTVRQFMSVANSLEKVGVSAYNGALAIMESPDLQTAAATIDTVEARHASFLQTANGGDPFPENFDVALDGRQIITLASPFIKQCSFDLGFVPFGQLKVSNRIHLPESDVEVAFQRVGGQNFCNWLFAEQSIVVPLNGNICEIPRGARGDVYLMITNDPTPVSLKKTNTIVAGPTIVTIDTAHSDSCKRLFNGKYLKEGKLNEPIDHGTIPYHIPSGDYDSIHDVGDIPSHVSVPPSNVGDIPPLVTSTPTDGAPPSEVSGIPSVVGAPSNVTSTGQDPLIQEMLAEVQAYWTEFGMPPPTGVVDPATGLPVEHSGIRPVLDPATGLPILNSTLPKVDSTTELPVEPTPTVTTLPTVDSTTVEPTPTLQPAFRY